MPSTVLSNNNFYVPNLWMEHEPPTNQLKFNSWWCSNMFSAHPFKKHPKTGSLSQLRRKGYYRIQKKQMEHWNQQPIHEAKVSRRNPQMAFASPQTCHPLLLWCWDVHELWPARLVQREPLGAKHLRPTPVEQGVGWLTTSWKQKLIVTQTYIGHLRNSRMQMIPGTHLKVKNPYIHSHTCVYIYIYIYYNTYYVYIYIYIYIHRTIRKLILLGKIVGDQTWKIGVLLKLWNYISARAHSPGFHRNAAGPRRAQDAQCGYSSPPCHWPAAHP